MDIVAHALWATAAGKTWNMKSGKPLRVPWFAVWTMFPDLFSFAPMVAVELWNRLAGTAIARPRSIGGASLYELSHSFVIFALVFAAASLLFRRPVWELLGWPLHIAIDIPTHSRYLTPFLWPLSDFRIAGIGWWEPWFMVANYAALALVYVLLWVAANRTRQAADA